MIKLCNISKKIGSKKVIQNLSLDILKNRITAICGPNGAGKTTIIRMILKLVNLDSGLVKYGTNLNQISFLFHNSCLFSDLTLKENISFFMESKGIRLDLKKLYKVSEELNLEKDINRKISTFSQGMIQKADLIRALMENPEFLILDEPTANLDPEGKVKVREILKKKVKNNDLTVLLTSHLLDEVERLADYVYIINLGELCWHGGVKEDLAEENIDLESKFIEILNSKGDRNEKIV